jgi:hypothetical protein
MQPSEGRKRGGSAELRGEGRKPRRGSRLATEVWLFGDVGHAVDTKNSIRLRIKIHVGDLMLPVWHRVYRGLIITGFWIVRIGRRQDSARGFLLSAKGLPLLDGNWESSDREYLAKRLAARNGGGGLPLPGSRPPFQVPAVESLAVQAYLYPTPDACAHADSNRNTS